MPWFRVDDSFYDHPKVFDAPDCAVALWTRAGTWSARNLTNGFVPSAMLARFCSDPETAAAELVRRRLWTRARGGYRFHDWDHYQPTKQAVENERKQARERMRELRKRRSEDKLFGRTSDELPPNFGRSSQPHPGPLPGSTADAVNRTNGSSDARASPETIESIITEIRDTTGRHVSAEWAARVAADVLGDRQVASPAAYIRQAIRREPQRFVPTSQPPPVADVLAATVNPHGRHARKDTSP